MVNSISIQIYRNKIQPLQHLNISKQIIKKKHDVMYIYCHVCTFYKYWVKSGR